MHGVLEVYVFRHIKNSIVHQHIQLCLFSVLSLKKKMT